MSKRKLIGSQHSYSIKEGSYQVGLVIDIETYNKSFDSMCVVWNPKTKKCEFIQIENLIQRIKEDK